MSYSNPEKQKEYQRNWARSRRASWLEGRKCVICGSCEDLEIDHVDPERKTSHRIWSWSKENREVELDKCQVLCNPCHKKKTRAWKSSKARSLDELHGTFTGYTKHKCRCDQCRAYKKAAHRREKIRNRL